MKNPQYIIRNFLILISLQPDGVNLWYLKIIFFYITIFIVWNIGIIFCKFVTKPGHFMRNISYNSIANYTMCQSWARPFLITYNKCIKRVLIYMIKPIIVKLKQQILVQLPMVQIIYNFLINLNLFLSVVYNSPQ